MTSAQERSTSTDLPRSCLWITVEPAKTTTIAPTPLRITFNPRYSTELEGQATLLSYVKSEIERVTSYLTGKLRLTGRGTVQRLSLKTFNQATGSFRLVPTVSSVENKIDHLVHIIKSTTEKARKEGHIPQWLCVEAMPVSELARKDAEFGFDMIELSERPEAELVAEQMALSSDRLRRFQQAPASVSREGAAEREEDDLTTQFGFLLSIGQEGSANSSRADVGRSTFLIGLPPSQEELARRPPVCGGDPSWSDGAGITTPVPGDGVAHRLDQLVRSQSQSQAPPASGGIEQSTGSLASLATEAPWAAGYEPENTGRND